MPSNLLPTASGNALLIEDDPVTREFLGEALKGAGWIVHLAPDVATALRLAGQQQLDLLLCDRRLPDGDAFDIARALWCDGAAPTGGRPFAIALSAEVDDALRARLLRAGFHAVLAKPVSLADLLAALPATASIAAVTSLAATAQIAEPGAGEYPVLDDAAALTVCGNIQTVDALRALLANELQQTLDAIRNAGVSGDTEALGATLHRLRSSCGFCGAAALGAAVARAAAEIEYPGERARAVAQVLAQGSALVLRLAVRSRR